MDLVELYVIIDDFCKAFMPRYLKILKNKKQITRVRTGMLSTSEIVWIILLFQESGFACFKWYYDNKVLTEYRCYFRQLPSYNRFTELMPNSLLVLLRLFNYLTYLNRRNSIGIEYIDSTKIGVCHNKRIRSNKVFSGVAEIGKSTMGWFFGFKLHITCDTSGNLTGMSITKGNVDDRVPVVKLINGFKGKLFADKGYLSKTLAAQLADMGVTLITTARNNMKSRLMPAELFDVIMLKKRSIIESVFNLLKNRLQLCHTRHRSIANFVVYIISVITGYQLFANKPKITLNNLICPSA